MLLILSLVHMTSSCAALFKTIVCFKSEKRSYYFFRYIQSFVSLRTAYERIQELEHFAC